jgi:uncharacterized lipoprotein YddW (UPF0748 family)
VRTRAAVLLVLVACASDVDPSTEAPIVPPEPDIGPVNDVSHPRELRGAWISSVFNGTWPSATGLGESAAKSELVAIFDALASVHMNAVFLQVRPESDALYRSELEPWSRFLTGRQGDDPGWDPLAYAIEEGHRRGLEIHAWLNPYRAAASRTRQAPNHVSRTIPTAVRTYGEQLWMDPGVAVVRAHILAVVRDILARYDVDGIHLDDYFYPYPIDGASFDDAASYAAYSQGGGTLAKDAWRRSNVDTLVRELGALVGQVRPDVRFGISPFGIYRPGIPEGITGLDAYAVLSADAPKWIAEGWVDYLAPQLYWPTTQKAQAFGALATWWGALARDGRSIFIGHDATRAGTGAFTTDEYGAQLAKAGEVARGSIFFSAKPIVTDAVGLRTNVLGARWAKPAATPVLASAARAALLPAPRIEVADTEVRVVAAGARSVAAYKNGTLEVLVPAALGTGGETRIVLDRGAWAITVLDRRGVESRPAAADLP